MSEKQIAVPNDHLRACAIAIGKDRFGSVKIAKDHVEGFNPYFGVRIYHVLDAGSYLPDGVEFATLSGSSASGLRAHKCGNVVCEGDMITYDCDGVVIVMGGSYPIDTDQFFVQKEEIAREGLIYANPLILEKFGRICRTAFGTRDFGAKGVSSNDFYRCGVGLRVWREGSLFRLSLDYNGLYRLEGIAACIRE